MDGWAGTQRKPGTMYARGCTEATYSGRAVMLFMKQKNEENNRRLGSRMRSTG